MKTPIQELIDTFEEMNTGIDPSVDVRFVLGLLRSKLEKEKDAIMAAYYAQILHPSEDYYNERYNTKEE